MTESKLKLKCFNCKRGFKHRSDVFRDSNNYPICEDCLYEELEFWEDDFREQIIDEIKLRFNRNYKRWEKWFFENHEICDGPLHDIEWYTPKKDLVEWDGNKYCLACVDFLIEQDEQEGAM